MLAGLARDGGLYLPQSYPAFSRETIAGFAGKPYGEVARSVLMPFVGNDLDEATLSRMIETAYAGFRHPAIAPLSRSTTILFVLELFHGPTLAFKDLRDAAARAADGARAARSAGHTPTIVGATSGDTGAAAIEAFRGLANIDVVIFYPHQRVSPVQRRQMTTVEGDNIHVVALEGTFDDCQAIVKALFNACRLPRRLWAVGRQLDQLGARARAGRLLLHERGGARRAGSHRRSSYCVPTGNFGDILAGLDRQAHGPADRAPRHRHERERHPRARPRDRRLRDPRRDPPDAIAVDGHPGLLEFRAAAVRTGNGRDARPRPQHDGRAEAVARLHDSSRDHARAIRAEFDAGRTERGRHDREIARAGTSPASSSIPTPPSACMSRARTQARGDPATPDGAYSGPRMRRNSPTRSSARSACGRRCRPLWLISSASRSASRCSPTTRPQIERFIRGRVDQGRALKTASHERRDHHPALRPARRHRSHAASRDRRARRLGRGGLAPRGRCASTGCRICSSTWPSRARDAAPRSPSPRRSRRPAATSTRRRASSRPPITRTCSRKTPGWRLRSWPIS